MGVGARRREVAHAQTVLFHRSLPERGAAPGVADFDVSILFYIEKLQSVTKIFNILD